MKDVILHPSRIPIYGFLSVINNHQPLHDQPQDRKILDCGAGGAAPPLALFQQYGIKCWGIDISPEQLEGARQYCQEQGIELDLRQGDMRQLPFPDGTFDYVYEHYSMCHLCKSDTNAAIEEMLRVLKPGGLCFLGVISLDTWPKSIFGQEEQPGEYWGGENGVERVRHSLFTDQEADDLVAAWEIVLKEKRVQYLRETAEETSLAEWMELRQEGEGSYSQDDWQARYERRAEQFRYVHLYYYLKKL